MKKTPPRLRLKVGDRVQLDDGRLGTIIKREFNAWEIELDSKNVDTVTRARPYITALKRSYP